jgi:hypothetical protein
MGGLMKIKVRSDDASLLHKHDWPQMDDWLAELRDDSGAEQPGESHAGADGAGDPWSEALAQADALAAARARADARAGAQAQARAQADALAAARARAQARALAEARARAGATERAVIGDQLRMPVMWCEMGSCISLYTHPAALGEADTRARAIGTGWRIDALGRLACPRCQQTDPWFWASCPVVPRDRYMAVAQTARAADSAAGGTGDDPVRAASGYPPASQAERERHHDFPDAPAENPAGTLKRAPWFGSAVRAWQARGGRQAAASPSQ